MTETPARTLKRGILFFWAVWFLAVFLTNLFDVLRVYGVVSANFPAVSDNYLLVERTTAIYGFPSWLNDFLFMCLTAVEAFCSGYFFRSWFVFGNEAKDANKTILSAFSLAIALFAAFIVSCEIFIVYEIEGAHFRVFTALIASLLLIYWKLDQHK